MSPSPVPPAARWHAHGRGIGTLALWGFWVLFPLFFVYQTVIARGWLPDVARGLWGTGSVAFALAGLVTLPVLWRLRQFARSTLTVTFFAFVGFSACWIATNALILDGGYVGPAAMQIGGTWVSWIALFFIGAWLPWRRPATVLVLTLGMLCMTATLLANFDPSRLLFDMRAQASGSAEVAGYQGFARSMAVTGILLVGALRRRTSVLLVGAASAVMLFTIGARSEFFGFVIVVGVYATVQFGRDTLAGRTYVLLVLVSAAIVASLVFDTSALMQSRQLEVLSLSEATSWVARNELLNSAFAQLAGSPLLGDFGAHFLVRSGGGGYAHNALSAWVSLGLLGFLLYAGMLVAAAWMSTRRYLRDGLNGTVWGMAMSMSLFSLLLCIVAKPVFWAVPALAWGLVLNAEAADRFARLRQSEGGARGPASRSVRARSRGPAVAGGAAVSRSGSGA